MIPKKVTILETTLRDGSYEVNFSFTANDTSVICRELEAAGATFIEVGHGVGLGASERGYGKAVQSDAEYLAAAAGALHTAKFGMFCIPGIATLDDIDLAHSYGMSFIRIGTNVTEVTHSEEFIKRAKKHGMIVAANYMKSYALTPEQFAQQVLLSEKYGADMVYIVDSAGGMFADDLQKYVNAIRAVSAIPLGFHGHDNLGLANANSIAAADMGIAFVDSSLQGLGRSAGNACTESLAAALEKRGYDTGLDKFKLFDIGQRYIMPMLQLKGKAPLDIVSGFAEFHSSYMPHIHRAAAKYQVDPLKLIIKMCAIDKVNLDPEVLNKTAEGLQHEKDLYLSKHNFSRYVGGEQDERKS